MKIAGAEDMDKKLHGWRSLAIGAVITEPGSSIRFKTGDWRAYKPLRDQGKCVKCLICWVYCPDAAVTIREDGSLGFDYDFCKGCGICFKECPREAITMIEEVA